MICNSCKKYSVRSDMEAIGLCVHCLALAVKDQQIADLTAQVAKLQADQEKRYKAYADIERQKIDLKAQVAECRMYLRGCLGHHFDDTPIEQVAKDVSRAYHKRVAAEEDLKAQVATADALVAQAIADGEKDCEDLQAQVEWLANKCMDMDKLHGQRTNLWWIEMAKNRAGGE